MLHPRNFVVERLPEIPFLGLTGNEAGPYLQAVAGAYPHLDLLVR